MARSASLSKGSAFANPIYSSLRAESDLSQAECQIDKVLGENCLVHFAPENGRHRRGFASVRSLERAIDAAAVRSLRRFFLRQIGKRKREITCFRVEPMFNFDFLRFVSLFVEEVVPSQVLEYAQLCHSRSWRIEVPWNVVLDPMSITYFTVADRSRKYPFAHERDLDSVMFLFRGMDYEDIKDEIVSLAIALGTKDSTFYLRLHGFAEDSRELWEIEDAICLLAAFLQSGGIRLLTFSTTIKEKRVPEVPWSSGSAPGLGAFEVWLIVHRRWEMFFGNPREHWVPFLTLFYSDLIASDDSLRNLIETFSC